MYKTPQMVEANV